MAKTYRGTGTPGTSGTPVPSQADLDAAVAAAQSSATNAAASEGAAETSENNAATSETNAGVSETNAAASEAAADADAIATSADASATAADAVSTAADAASTASDATDTGVDAASTAADAIATAADAVATAADLVATNQDTIDTAADLAQTNLDQISCDADATATAADAIATAADAASTAADAVSTAADAASAAASYDSFDDRYLGAKASDPTLDNDGDALLTGALYFNTTTDAMRVYSGSSWSDVGSSTLATFQYSSTTAGQTAITGADDNANTLSYTVGFARVFYNGQLLSDTDYTETSTSVLTLADGIEVAGDQITILAFGTFDVANTYTQAQSDANYAPKATNTGEVATTSGTAVTWSSIPAWVTKISILVDQVSFAGTDHMRIQLGIASGTVTTGYVTDSVIMTHNATSDWVTRTDGFVVFIGNASRTVQGVIELHKGVGDHWFNTATAGLPVSEQGAITGGVCDIGGDLTDVIINGDNGSAFDNGSVTLIYE